MEAWKKVLVEEEFLTTAHGQYDCVFCHGGKGEEPEMEAVAGFIARALAAVGAPARLASVADDVTGLCRRFPLDLPD